MYIRLHPVGMLTDVHNWLQYFSIANHIHMDVVCFCFVERINSFIARQINTKQEYLNIPAAESRQSGR